MSQAKKYGVLKLICAWKATHTVLRLLSRYVGGCPNCCVVTFFEMTFFS